MTFTFEVSFSNLKGGCLLFKIKAFFFLKSLQFNFFNYLLKKKTLQLDPACLGRAHEGCHQVSQILKTLSSLSNLQLWPTLLLRAGSAPLEGLQLCPGRPAPLQKTECEGSRHPQNPRKCYVYFPNNFIEMCQEYTDSTNV